MKSSSVKYGTRFGCRFGQPHDFVLIRDNKSFKVERCKICNIRRKYNKGYKARVDNVQYLKDHVRNYAQPTGSTKRVYNKTYQPSKCKIVL